MKLAFTNFRSFSGGPHVFEFQPGTLFVVGDNKDEGFDSNGCLSGDTLIEVPRDCRETPEGVPIRNLVGETPLVYSYNFNTQRIDVARASRVWSTGVKPVYRVTFLCKGPGGAKGTLRFRKQHKTLTATANHPVLMRDGSWKVVGDLTLGDMAMPFYRYTKDTRYMFLRTLTSNESDHRISARFLGEIPDGYHVHHKNHNTFDNRPENLEVLSASDHFAHHGSLRPPTYIEHPRGMLGKKHKRIPRTCLGCERVFNATPQGRYCSSACYHRTAYRKKQYVNHKVVKIERIGEEEVFDMEVPGYGNFVANHLIVHNSGKTTLAALLPYALYGQIATGADKDEIISYGERECCVELFLPGFQLRRVKSRSKAETLEFYTDDIGGWVKGDLPDVQARLVKWLGISRKTFFNSYWIDRESKTVQFLFAKPSERQKILEELIDQDYFAEAKIRATRMRQTEEATLNALRGVVATLQAKRDGLVRSKETAEADLERIRTRAEAAREAHAKRVAASVEEFREARRVLQRHIEKLDQLKTLIHDTSSAKLRDEISDVKTQMALKEQILYREIERVDVCVKCGQRLPADAYAKQQRERAEAATFLQSAKQTIAKMKEMLSRILETESQIVSLEAKVFAGKQKMRDIVSRQQAMKAEEPRPDEDLSIMEGRIASLGKDIEKMEERILAEEIKRGEVEARVPRIRFFEEAFGSHGIPNLLLDDIRSLMTQFTGQYVENLSRGQVAVEYPASDKGFEIRMTYKGQEADIATFSRGEAWRACLSVLLALRRTIAYLHKCSLDFLVMDDPFGDLDESGEAAVVDLANHLSNEVRHVIVTAPRQVSGARAVQMTRVEKRGGVSRIV